MPSGRVSASRLAQSAGEHAVSLSDRRTWTDAYAPPMRARMALAAALIGREKKRPDRSKMLAGRVAPAGAPTSWLSAMARLACSVLRRVHCWNQNSESILRRTSTGPPALGHLCISLTLADGSDRPTLTVELEASGELMPFKPTGTRCVNCSRSKSTVVGTQLTPAPPAVALAVVFHRCWCSPKRQIWSGSSSCRWRKKASPSAHDSEAIWWLRPIVLSPSYGNHSR